MSRIRCWWLSGTLLIILGSPVFDLMAQEWSDRPYEQEITAALANFSDQYPAVRQHRDGLGRTYLFGAPITRGASELDAVQLFLQQYAPLFGIFYSDLELIYETELLDQAATVFAYRQIIDDVPVEFSAFRVLVRPDLITGDDVVVYAAGHLALQPLRGYAPVQLTPEQATNIARRELPEIDPSLWSHGELVIQASANLGIDSRLVYRVKAIDLADAIDLSVIIDPETGQVIEIRDDIVHVDVEGEVRGRVSQNNRPDTASNPAVEQGVGAVPVSISGSGSTHSALDGSFTCPHGGTAPVNLGSSLVGSWVRVENDAAVNLTVTTPATPPGPAIVELNPISDPLIQAQVNAFHYTNITHDFIRDRTASGVAGIDVPILCNVNILDTCNAFFSPGAQSINFYQAGGGCVNTAYSSVVSHEYGHFIVDRLGLGQGGFGEGYGDLMSMLIYDDPIIGHDFAGPGSQVRDPVAANIQYPCSSNSVHTCGQILGACFWKIRDNFGSVFGSAEGLTQAQQLFVDWSLVTLGGSGDSSAHPQTVIEVLTVDDDDTTLDNGTPNFTEICAAFEEHSISCPIPPAILISFPIGLPGFLQPQTEQPVRLQVLAGTQDPDPNSGQMFLRQGPGPFTPYPVELVSPDQYESIIPGMPCGEMVEYYFSFGDLSGGVHTAPPAGATAAFTVPVLTEQLILIEDPLEDDLGWTVGAPSDTATTGVWTRVTPIGTVAAPGADHSDSGSQCWVTGQGSVGGSQGENDVDGGPTTLYSPILDLTAASSSGSTTFSIEYWRWYVNGTGATPYTDPFIVAISSDLVNWVTVEQVGPQNGPDTNGGWILHSFDPADLVPLTSTVQLRFVAADLNDGSIVEAGIDDFVVQSNTCEDGPTFRRGDPNLDGGTDISDTVAILQYLFAGATLDCLDAADIFDTGTINISDAIALVTFLFANGVAPSEPFPFCGVDPGIDSLDECSAVGSCP